MNTSATLIFLCGKMAAGKSTLARELAEHRNAILLVQDELLEQLFPGEITDIPGFLDRSSRLRNAITPHICAVLSKGISVVLDFPGNTKAQRAWFREIFERAEVEHEFALHQRVGCCVQASAQGAKPAPAAGNALDDRCGVRDRDGLFSAAVRGRRIQRRPS